MIRRFFVMVSLMVLGGMTAACGADTDCRAGDDCGCTGQDVCVWNCKGGDCAFTADTQGTVTLTCDDGGCSLAASGQSTVGYDCAGGTCTATVSSQATVNLVCEGGGCTANVSDSGTCNISGCTDCTCTENAITATCSSL